MNEAKLKKDIDRAAGMAKSLHDEAAALLANTNLDSGDWSDTLGFVCGLATLAWYLEYISEGVSA